MTAFCQQPGADLCPQQTEGCIALQTAHIGKHEAVNAALTWSPTLHRPADPGVHTRHACQGMTQGCTNHICCNKHQRCNMIGQTQSIEHQSRLLVLMHTGSCTCTHCMKSRSSPSRKSTPESPGPHVACTYGNCAKPVPQHCCGRVARLTPCGRVARLTTYHAL